VRQPKCLLHQQYYSIYIRTLYAIMRTMCVTHEYDANICMTFTWMHLNQANVGEILVIK